MLLHDVTQYKREILSERVIFGSLNRLPICDPRTAIGPWHLGCLPKLKKTVLRLVTYFSFLSPTGIVDSLCRKLLIYFLWSESVSLRASLYS